MLDSFYAFYTHLVKFRTSENICLQENLGIVNYVETIKIRVYKEGEKFLIGKDILAFYPVSSCSV